MDVCLVKAGLLVYLRLGQQEGLVGFVAKERGMVELQEHKAVDERQRDANQ